MVTVCPIMPKCHSLSSKHGNDNFIIVNFKASSNLYRRILLIHFYDKNGDKSCFISLNRQVLDTHAINCWSFALYKMNSHTTSTLFRFIFIKLLLLCFVAYPVFCYLWPWILNQNCHINLISPLKFLIYNFICMSIFNLVLFWGDYRFIWPLVMYICVIYLLIFLHVIILINFLSYWENTLQELTDTMLTLFL